LNGDEIHWISGFAHRIQQPERPSGEALVLLHGSGGDETTLLPFAARIAPAATLVGVRGRVLQDGVTRWFRRLTPVRFDQKDIRAEANAFAAFLLEAAKAYRLNLATTALVGYSNGANLVAAMALINPGLVRRAILMRSMPVLTRPPLADLSGAGFLIISGKEDRLYRDYAPALAKLLRGTGAEVEAHVVPAGHEFGDEDARIAARWLASAREVPVKVELQ
jgi:phospholipase/carboxylesterase